MTKILIPITQPGANDHLDLLIPTDADAYGAPNGISVRRASLYAQYQDAGYPRDLAALGIRVNAIAPGTMGTPMLLNMPEQVQQGLVADIQFPKRLGLPSEYAALVIHLAENAYINGETIRLDGALRMQPK